MPHEVMIGARQIKAGRALLDWSQEDLAHASNLSIATIRKLELGHISPRHSTTSAIRQAIEGAGLEFIHSEGVRRRTENISIYEGASGFTLFLEDIHHTLKRNGGEVSIVSSETAPAHSDDSGECSDYLEQILDINSEVTIKYLLGGMFSIPLASSRFEFRSISRQYIEPIPFYVYGDKYAVIVPSADLSPRIVVIQSSAAARTSRRQFYSMWEKATPLQGLIENITNVTKFNSCR